MKEQVREKVVLKRWKCERTGWGKVLKRWKCEGTGWGKSGLKEMEMWGGGGGGEVVLREG